MSRCVDQRSLCLEVGRWLGRQLRGPKVKVIRNGRKVESLC